MSSHTTEVKKGIKNLGMNYARCKGILLIYNFLNRSLPENCDNIINYILK